MAGRRSTGGARTDARSVAARALGLLAKGRIQRLGEVLDEAPLQGREMALCRQLTLGAERNGRFCDFVLGLLASRGLPDDPLLRAALRLGAYQLLFLRVPARAAVHETVALCTAHRRGFVNAVLRRLAGMVRDGEPDPAAPRTSVALGAGRVVELPAPGLPAGPEPDPLAVRHSLPDFVVSRWRLRHGEAAARQVAEASSAEPVMFLRAAAARGDGAVLAERLRSEDVITEATAHPAMLRWVDGAVPVRTRAFAEGWFVVQDPTAVRAAEAVAAAPGATVLDLCAAPGTKTTLLAEQVGPGGRVLAWDADPRRRARIGENAARLGLQDRIVVLEAESELREGMADAVLADVPCSNTGVLARRVEVRRRLQPGSFAELRAVQREILARAIGLCRRGGRVVYSTCSIEPEECQAVAENVEPALARLVRQEVTLPQAGVGDGGYVAVFERA